MISQEILVELGERSYRVLVGSGILGTSASLLSREGVSGHMVIITDRNVGRRYLRPLQKHLAENGHQVVAITLVPGESQKNLKTVQQVYAKMLAQRIGRTSTILALGGGVVGDLAGFVAATYHRGINLVQLPTSLLAQVDSSIGGKTGVNHPLGKNMIGAFHQPKVVIADADVLQTLPAREMVCGLGEIVKYGVILDEPFFAFVENHWNQILGRDREIIAHVVGQCAKLKAGLVSLDEKESSVRVILNCGHTIGHALEAAGHYRSLKHGEAVLLGLAAESFIAMKLNVLSSDDYERILGLIRQIPMRRQLSFTSNIILSLIGHDKKARAGKNRFVLPVRIGKTTVIEGIEHGLIREALRALRHSGLVSSVE